MVSFRGVDLAVLVHALYYGTRAQGMGRIHDRPDLTVDEVRAEITRCIHTRPPGPDRQRVVIDYYHGRPLKVKIDLGTLEFDAKLYDRDAGEGAAARVVAELRRKIT